MERHSHRCGASWIRYQKCLSAFFLHPRIFWLPTSESLWIFKRERLMKGSLRWARRSSVSSAPDRLKSRISWSRRPSRRSPVTVSATRKPPKRQCTEWHLHCGQCSSDHIISCVFQTLLSYKYMPNALMCRMQKRFDAVHKWLNMRKCEIIAHKLESGGLRSSFISCLFASVSCSTVATLRRGPEPLLSMF